MSDLTEKYSAFNRRYFLGRLPRYRVVRRAISIGGRCDDRRRLIVIRPGIVGTELDCLLLHEMCHIGIPGHRWKFRARLQRVARRAQALGDHEFARLAVAEWELYDSKQVMSWSNEIDSDLESVMLSDPDATWSRVRRFLIRTYGLFPGEPTHRRVLISARRQWAKLKAENARSGD